MDTSCLQLKTNPLICLVAPLLLVALAYAPSSDAATVSVDKSPQLIKPFDLAYRGYNNSPGRYDNRYKGGYNYGRVAPAATPRVGTPYYRPGYQCTTRCVPSAASGGTHCYKYCT